MVSQQDTRFSSRYQNMTQEMDYGRQPFHGNAMMPMGRNLILDRSSEGLESPHIIYYDDNWIKKNPSTNLGNMRFISKSKPELVTHGPSSPKTQSHASSSNSGKPSDSSFNGESMKTLDPISMTPSQFQNQLTQGGSDPWKRERQRLLNAEELMKLFHFRKFLKSAAISRRKLVRRVLEYRQTNSSCCTYDENGVRCTNNSVR